jgi:hypothetical protein
MSEWLPVRYVVDYGNRDSDRTVFRDSGGLELPDQRYRVTGFLRGDDWYCPGGYGSGNPWHARCQGCRALYYPYLSMSIVAEREPASVGSRERHLTLPDGQRVKFIRDDNGDEVVLFDKVQGDRIDSGYEAPFPVLIPYTVRRTKTMAAAPRNATWVDVSCSPIAYYATLLDWWSRGETFMIVEHDICVTPEIIREMDECPEPICRCSYSDLCCAGCREAWRHHIGCTRFRREVVQSVPDAMLYPSDNWDWRETCNGLGENLMAAGYGNHWHGSVLHSHEPLST